MRLFYDTETTGLDKPGLDPEHPSQPDLAQLGAKLFDAEWRCTASFVVLIKPDGWTMEPEAESHHGISEARCARHGVPLAVALAMFKSLALNAKQIVAHHMNFDRRVIAVALHRCGSDGLWWKRKSLAFGCTMEAATPVCQLKGEFGFKFPSLEEAHRHFYPADAFDTRHDAEEDLLASVRIFRALEAIGAAPAPPSPTAGRF